MAAPWKLILYIPISKPLSSVDLYMPFIHIHSLPHQFLVSHQGITPMFLSKEFLTSTTWPFLSISLTVLLYPGSLKLFHHWTLTSFLFLLFLLFLLRDTSRHPATWIFHLPPNLSVPLFISCFLSYLVQIPFLLRHQTFLFTIHILVPTYLSFNGHTDILLCDPSYVNQSLRTVVFPSIK